MNLKTIIANIDLCNDMLDRSGNQIAYPARGALVSSARAVLKAKENVSYEQKARFASLCAVNYALSVVFDLRPLADTVRFVMKADAPEQPTDYGAIVDRDHLNGRVFLRDKKHRDELIALRREQDIAHRAEIQGEVSDVIDLIESVTDQVIVGESMHIDETGVPEALGFDQELIEGESDAICERIAKACIDAKDNVQRDLDRCFLPDRYKRLNETLLGINSLLEMLGITDDSLREVRTKRREHLNAILAAPEQPAKAKRVRVVKPA